jgi:hypothetical protein
MPAASAGLFIIDFIARPFAKIFEKMPFVALLLCLMLYGVVAYFIVKSTFLADQHD